MNHTYSTGTFLRGILFEDTLSDGFYSPKVIRYGMPFGHKILNIDTKM